MSRFVNGVIIGIVTFIAILSVVWYGQDAPGGPSVRFVEMENQWGAVGPSTSEIRSLVTFENPQRTPAQLVRIEHEVILNGERLAWQDHNSSLVLPPVDQRAMEISARFPSEFVASWWSSHVRGGEETRILIRGSATFLVLQKPVLVPYEWESPWTTQLEQSLRSSLGNCASGESPCIESGTAEWSSGDALTLRVKMLLQNPNATEIRIRNWTMQLLLHEVAVARSDLVEGPIDLAPEAEQEIEAVLRFDSGWWEEWWQRHVESCELSPLTLQVEYSRQHWADAVYDANSTETASPQPVVGDRAWTLEGSDFTTRFVCART